MRILTLVTGPAGLDDAAHLTREIRAFNAEIDFRLRFLHIEIEEVHGAPPGVVDDLRARIDRTDVRTVDGANPLEAAASMALLLAREEPAVLVVAGRGDLLEPGAAAARVCGTRLAFFGAQRGRAEGALDLGEDARAAVEGLTGVAREFGPGAHGASSEGDIRS